jgi:outer membrane protein assembly factor BamB
MWHPTRWLLSTLALASLSEPGLADDWPQWMGPNRDDVWRETGILEKFPKDGPKVKWRVPTAWGYAGPAVADGRVYLMDYVTDADIRKQNSAMARAKITGKERVRCLDAGNGNVIWTHEYDCPYAISYPGGPRCTPTIHGGKVYSLGAEGNLFCLDAKKGDVVWSKDFKKDYSAKTALWGYASHPLVDGQRLFCVVGGEGSVAVAFDKDTGKELWKSLSTKKPDEQGYCPPTMIEAGGKKQLLIWDAEFLNSLDPDTGKPYWSVKLVAGQGMSIAAPRREGKYLFTSGAFGGSLLLELAPDKPEVKEAWRATKTSQGLYAVNSTPFLEGGMIYGVDRPGQLRGVKLETGEQVWDVVEPVSDTKRPQGSGTVFLIKNGDRFFLFNEKGELIIAKLTPKGYEQIDKCKLLEPTNNAFGRDVVWSHPAFANKCIYARNDKEIVCASLAAE